MNTNPDTNHDTNTDQTFLLAEIKRLLLSAVHSATICWHGCENDENINETLGTKKCTLVVQTHWKSCLSYQNQSTSKENQFFVVVVQSTIEL